MVQNPDAVEQAGAGAPNQATILIIHPATSSNSPKSHGQLNCWPIRPGRWLIGAGGGASSVAGATPADLSLSREALEAQEALEAEVTELAGHLNAATSSTAERHQVVVHVDATALNENGEPLDVRRKTRTIPPAIRRALQVRDPGCCFPGCTYRRYLDAHHVEHCADGGATKRQSGEPVPFASPATDDATDVSAEMSDDFAATWEDDGVSHAIPSPIQPCMLAARNLDAPKAWIHETLCIRSGRHVDLRLRIGG